MVALPVLPGSHFAADEGPRLINFHLVSLVYKFCCSGQPCQATANDNHLELWRSLQATTDLSAEGGCEKRCQNKEHTVRKANERWTIRAGHKLLLWMCPAAASTSHRLWRRGLRRIQGSQGRILWSGRVSSSRGGGLRARRVWVRPGPWRGFHHSSGYCRQPQAPTASDIQQEPEGL